MTLSDLLERIDRFQDLQLVNAKTGKCITDVTYMEGGSISNIEAINDYKDEIIHGISSDITNDGGSYLVITLDIKS